MKELLVISVIIYILMLNVVFYIRKTKLTRNQYKKATVFLQIIWIAIILTILIFEGFSTVIDEERNWNSIDTSFISDNTSINISVQVDTIVRTNKGFFIDTPLFVVIYDGKVKFQEDYAQINDSITMEISLSHHPFYSENNTGIKHLTNIDLKWDNETKGYKIEPPPEGWLISYSYSGEKELVSKIIINGKETLTIRKPLIKIEKSHIKAQVEMSRAIIIFALWAIFATLFKPLERVVDWWYQIDNILSCPTCNSTNIRERKTKKPKYICNKCKNEFDESK